MMAINPKYFSVHDMSIEELKAVIRAYGADSEPQPGDEAVLNYVLELILAKDPEICPVDINTAWEELQSLYIPGCNSEYDGFVYEAPCAQPLSPPSRGDAGTVPLSPPASTASSPA